MRTSQHSPLHVKHGSKEECNLCDCVQQREEELLISSSTGFGKQKECEVSACSQYNFLVLG